MNIPFRMPWGRALSLIGVVTSLFLATSRAVAAPSVWELHLTKGDSVHCALDHAQPRLDAQDRLFLDADTRGATGEWHSCIVLPQGLLKAGKDYVVTLDYEVVDRSAPDSYFYVFGRSKQLGYGADRWQRWHGKPGERGTAKLRISPTTDDDVITVGIHNQGALRIWNLKVLPGDGWAAIPLEGSHGAGAPPSLPTGAQPFTIDPPSNPSGPVLNLADFGAVADGDVPPASGPDRNHAAFVAAIAKCRELKAAKLVVPQGVYRIASGETVVFDGLSDFTFDGGGSTFLYHQIQGGAGMLIKNCTRTVFKNFNVDWDWKIDPLASVGRITHIGPNTSFFDMRFEGAAPLDPKRWITMNPLDEKLRVPGTGKEFGNFGPRTLQPLDAQTVRVWPTWPVPAKEGQLYLLRHYTYEKHAIVMDDNTQLSLQYVTVYSFPGIGFITGGDQHHFELLHCRITFPDHERRPITTTADGFHVGQSQGFIRLEDCDFGYMGDDCVNIHDNIHAGIRVVDARTLVATDLVAWRCPYAAGDPVEIRNGDFSPTGFTGKLLSATPDDKKNEVTLGFDRELPAGLEPESILFDHRYGSHNCIIRNCYFHENRARGLLCNTADWLIEGNRFFHNQHAAMLLLADVAPSWSEGFGARNVVIRNNRFEAANCLGVGDGAAVALGATHDGDTTTYPLIADVLFENNVFQEIPGPVVTATSFGNLLFRGNTILNQKPPAVPLKMRGALRAELGKGLWVEGNAWKILPDAAAPGLFYDPSTTSEIVSQGNHVQP